MKNFSVSFFLNKETIGKFLVRDEYILRIKSGKYHERKRHFVAISPRREHQARGGTLWTFSATWNYGPESRSWRARMHARWSFRSCRIRRVTCEPPQTHHAQFTVSINRADGRTDRPTDRPGARRKAEGRYIRRRTEILPCPRFVPNGTRVCVCIYDSVNADTNVRFWHDLAVALCAPSRNREIRGVVGSSLSLRRPRRNLRLLADINFFISKHSASRRHVSVEKN